MSFCYRRMTLFSCKCKLMLMVMVNKRRTLVPLLPENVRVEFGVWFFGVLVFGYWATFWFSRESQALKRNKEFIKTGKEMALK